MRIFKTKWLARLSRHEQITDANLKEAIARAERGIVDADLGGGLIKQRVARQGQGRSGGYRMIVVYRAKDVAVFIYGFAKSDRENIDPSELATMREIAAIWLNADAGRIARGIAEDEIQEIANDYEKA